MAPKVAPFTPSPNVTTTWTTMAAALGESVEVFAGSRAAMTTKMTTPQWFQKIYQACNAQQDSDKWFYSQLQAWVAEHLRVHVAEKLGRGLGGEEMVRLVARSFDEYNKLRRYACAVFSYVDQFYTSRVMHAQNTKVDNLSQMFLRQFHAVVFEAVKTHLLPFIIAQVNKRRNGENVDMALVKSAIDIFVHVGTITLASQEMKAQAIRQDFEEPYEAALKDWYSKLARPEYDHSGPVAYMSWVERNTTQEQGFASEFLVRADGAIHVRNACVDVMIGRMFDEIIRNAANGLKALLENRRGDDIKRLFAFMNLVPEQAAVKCMAAEFAEWVSEKGQKHIDEMQAKVSDGPISLEKELMEGMLSVHEEAFSTVSDLFDNNKILLDHCKIAFKKLVATKLTRKDKKPGSEDVDTKQALFAEMLATYVDAVLRKDIKDIIESDKENERLDKLVQIFKYLEDKDVFQEYHRGRLSKRLLQTTPHEDLERYFLMRLQIQGDMGKGYTFRMEGMLHDREATRQQTENFLRDVSSQGLPTEFSPTVLTSGHWPAYKSDTFVAPPSLRPCIEAFTRFYRKGFALRKLTWINQLGSATVIISFPKGAKDVAANMYQAAVLELVDENGRMSAAQLIAALALDARIVKGLIASMHLAKGFNLLARVDAAGAPVASGKTIADDDYFALNTDFTYKMRKFKLPTAATAGPAPGKEEAGGADDETDSRRKIQIDACVVRVMKSRRTLTYKELQELVIEQLLKLFVPQPRMIKGRIEDLVTRAYLRRDEEDTSTFHYLA